jgi:hypothetical protein
MTSNLVSRQIYQICVLFAAAPIAEAQKGGEGKNRADYKTVITFDTSTSYLSFPHYWWGHYATGRKVAGSIPNEVTGFFKLT